MSQRFSVKQFGAVVKALDEARAKLADREKRIRLACAAIPAKGFGVDPNSGEATHPYARVSERCILNVERYLDLRKPLFRRKKAAYTKTPLGMDSEDV